MRTPEKRTGPRDGRRLLVVGALILVAGCLTGSLLGAAVPLGVPRGAAEALARAPWQDAEPFTTTAAGGSNARAVPSSPRREAAQAQDVGELIRRLGDPDAHQRAMAACRIGHLRSTDVRRAIPALIELLGDATPVEGRLCRDDRRWRNGRWEDSSPGREAAIALEEAGSAAVEPVLEVLSDADPRRREHTALALGLLEDRRAVEGLSRLVRDDDDAAARARAAWALGMIEHPDGVPALEDAIDDADFEVRAHAAWALGMIESASGVDALVGALGDEEPEVREQAAWGLGMIESPRGVEGLAGALRDDDPEVREQAAWALGMIESPRATPALIVALGDDDPEVRKQAAWALGMIEDPSAAGALADALDDDDPEVRRQVMWALTMVIDEGSFGDIDPHELAEKLRRALREGGGA